MINAYLNTLRREYTGKDLTLTSTPKDPFLLFHQWFEDAVHANVLEPNAMHLSTVSPNGTPDGRIVLLKEITDRGFIFYTNYHSKKGRDLNHNASFHINFFWIEIMRQVRVSGTVEKLNRKLSEKYFDSRPNEAKISALISPQSETISSKAFLMEKIKTQKKEDHISCPENWGGYHAKANYFEFWQGKPSRFHDRVCYHLADTVWNKKLIAP